jgi:hypothetical protein
MHRRLIQSRGITQATRQVSHKLSADLQAGAQANITSKTVPPGVKSLVMLTLSFQLAAAAAAAAAVPSSPPSSSSSCCSSQIAAGLGGVKGARRRRGCSSRSSSGVNMWGTRWCRCTPGVSAGVGSRSGQAGKYRCQHLNTQAHMLLSRSLAACRQQAPHKAQQLHMQRWLQARSTADSGPPPLTVECASCLKGLQGYDA